MKGEQQTLGIIFIKLSFGGLTIATIMTSDNPLSNDDKLKKLLKDVDSIKSDAALATWRKSFLEVYQEYLDPDGVLNARDADGRLIKKLQGLAKASLKVQTLIESKNISKAQVTAEGSRGLTNLTEKCKEGEVAINAFCPKTSKEEDKVGYDKFELGAVLIKDGFQAYEIMTTTQKHIQQLKDGPLADVLDRNQVSILNFYFRGVQSFIDVMADLGLIGLAKQCLKVYKKAPRPKASQPGPNGEPPQDDFSEFKGKVKDPTGSPLLDVDDDNDGDGPSDEPVQSSKSKPKGGFKDPFSGKATSATKSAPNKNPNKNQPDDDEVPENEEEEDNKDEDDGDGDDGQPVLYWDPITGAIGRVSRKKLAPLILKEDEKNPEKEVNVGAIEDSDERTEVIWQLKKLEKKLEKIENSKPNWLDQIKKEKAAAKKKAGGNSGPKKTVSTPSKRSDTGSKTTNGDKDKNNGWGPSPLMAGSSSSSKSKGTRPKTVSNPSKSVSTPSKKKFLDDGSAAGDNAPAPPSASPSTSALKGNKKYSDYQGKYKTIAPKPANGGWSSVSSNHKK